MDNLEQILILLFRRVSAKMVLEGSVNASEFGQDTFASIAFAYLRQYSESELENMWSYYKDEFERRRVDRQGGMAAPDKGIRVFDALFHYADKMLTVQDNELLCRYESLLQWRMVTFEISEDLLAASYFSKARQPMEMSERGYAWEVIIGHNNYQLNAIMRRGISENHFHLYGSSPMFHISWISLMNHVGNGKVAENLERMDFDRRDGNIRYNASYREESLQIQMYQAAWIRVFFYAYLTDTKIELRTLQGIGSGQRWCRDWKGENGSQGSGGECQGNGTSQGLGGDLQENGGSWGHGRDWRGRSGTQGQGGDWKGRLLGDILWMFREEYRLLEYASELQSLLETLSNPVAFSRKDELEDYALRAAGDGKGKTDVFSGERWLLYSCLREIRMEHFDSQLTNLFYAYLLIKECIHAELTQTNSGVGFRNFQKYDRRKFQLADSAIYGNEFVRSAVRENMLSPHLLSLEIRISPGNTALKNIHYIRKLDRLIGEPRNKYYYVMHFIKRPDEDIISDDRTRCRHYSLRKRIRRQADAIIGMREKCPECASRLLGIDAASMEIGCRPEVFASEYRRLGNHVQVVDSEMFAGSDSGNVAPDFETAEFRTKQYTETIQYGQPRLDSVLEYRKQRGIDAKMEKLPQLRATYHVGEDFLDIADGLRAIDEAINFLNLDCGDRMGHALALGQDVEEWYRSKNYRILIPKQDYLDNIVWIYNRLIDFKIPGMEVLKGYLERKYVYFFDQIYGKNIDYALVDRILSEAKEVYQREGFPNIFHNDRYQFGIHQYYNAWKLRGDAPELYAHGYFDYHDDGTLEQISLANQSFPKEFGLRRRPEIFLLNYYYLYDPDVRKEGNRRIEVRIRPDYVEAVRLIQKEMQRLVGKKGIMVETNPSSNFKIGTFRDYAKHPIFQLYNSGLTYDAEKLAECPQISVSVNTDDKGVFSTSLENEYALLARALEEQMDAEGKPLYTKAMIYNWVEDVRKMGNEQSFNREVKRG